MSSNSRITRPFSTDQSDIDETTSELTWVQSKDDPLVVTFNRDPLGKEAFPYQLMVDLAPAIGNVCVFSGDFIPRTRLVPSVIRTHSSEQIPYDELSKELLKLPKCPSQIDPKDHVQTIVFGAAYRPILTNDRVRVKTPFPVDWKLSMFLGRDRVGLATVVTPEYVFCLFGTMNEEIENAHCLVWRRQFFFEELQNDGLQVSKGPYGARSGLLKYTTRPLHVKAVTNSEGKLCTIVYPIQTNPDDLLGHSDLPRDVFNEEVSGDLDLVHDQYFHTFRDEYRGWNKASLDSFTTAYTSTITKVERLGNNSFRFPKIDETYLECRNPEYVFTILRFIAHELGWEGAFLKILSFQVPYPSSEVETHLARLESPYVLVLDLEVEVDTPDLAAIEIAAEDE